MKSPILGGFSVSRSTNSSDNEAINLFMEIIETKDGNGPGALYLTPGLALLATVGDGPIRGALALGNTLYVVSGQSVYSVDQLWNATQVGTLAANGPVSMIQNGLQLAIFDGQKGYLLPGGYPLTGGAISSAGGLYAVGDTITLAPSSGTLVSAVQVTVDAVLNQAVTAYTLSNTGTTYSTASNVLTTTGGAQAGSGTGLELNIIAASGPITSSSIAAPGTGYAVGDTGVVTGGTGDATYQISAITQNGAVSAFSVSQPGAVSATSPSFSQSSTSGSGSGFAITGAYFGSFQGMTQIPLPFDNPTIGAITDGFGVLCFNGSKNIAASDQLDLSTWGALNYGVADQSPDNIVTVTVIHNEIYVLKETNTEVWVDAGLANFPFQPLTGVHMEQGCAAPFSVAKADESIIWLGRNSEGQGIILMAKGYQAAPIATQALVNEINAYPQIADATAYTFQQSGHLFYVINFPSAGKTWLYDITSSALSGSPIWSRLASFADGQFWRHWGDNCIQWQGKSIVGDCRNGNIYAYSLDVLTDNGTPRKWLRRWRALQQPKSSTTRFASLLINMQTGIGIDPSINPQVILRWSDDGGHNWSDERVQAVGRTGATSKNVKFNRLGSTRRFASNDRVFEVSSTDAFPVALIDAELEAE